jgi:hypothetical protein
MLLTRRLQLVRSASCIAWVPFSGVVSNSQKQSQAPLMKWTEVRNILMVS